MDKIHISAAPIESVWSMRQVVMYPDESLDFVKLDNDAAGMHLGLYEEGVLVSVISLFEDNGSIQFRKFATAVSRQGQGFGTKLLGHVMDWAKQNEKKSIWCNARLSATGMYEKFGMRPTGASWEKWGIEFIKMEKQLG
jgi:phosphoribosylformimino-5-aminoimidazole carboxamide ribotide isomerase